VVLRIVRGGASEARLWASSAKAPSFSSSRPAHADLWQALVARDPVTRVVRMPRARADDFYHLLRDHADAMRASSWVLEHARAIVFKRVARIVGSALGIPLSDEPEAGT
jgi:uncharacterized protein YceH (UPF0502 family)